MSHPFDRHGLNKALPAAPRHEGPARIVDLLQRAADASSISQQPLQNRITCFSDVVHDRVGADALPQLLRTQAPVAVRIEQVEDGLRAAHVDDVRVRQRRQHRELIGRAQGGLAGLGLGVGGVAAAQHLGCGAVLSLRFGLRRRRRSRCAQSRPNTKTNRGCLAC
jgi:hypothetical protein